MDRFVVGVGGGLNGLGEVEVTMIGGDDWRDKFLDIFVLDGLIVLLLVDVSDTLLVGGRLLSGVTDLTVNLERASNCWKF